MATVAHDAHVLVIDHAMVTQLIVQHNQFTREMHDFVEERKRTMHTVVGTEHLEVPQTARHDVLKLIAMQVSRNGNQTEG